MYIGIEEVFIGGMAFALGTVVWAYSKVKSQVASGDTIHFESRILTSSTTSTKPTFARTTTMSSNKLVTTSIRSSEH